MTAPGTMVAPSIAKNCAYFFWSLTIRQDVNGGSVGTQAAPLRLVRASTLFLNFGSTFHSVATGVSTSAADARSAAASISVKVAAQIRRMRTGTIDMALLLCERHRFT